MDWVSDCLQLGRALAGVTEVLRNGRVRLHAHEVGDDGRRRLVRHGHLPEREIMTSIGPVAVRCPRVRDRTSGKGAGASVSRQQAGRNPSAQ